MSREDLDAVQDALQVAMLGDTPPRLNEMILVSRTGDQIPILPNVAFIRDESGTPAVIVLTIQDVSDLVSANREIREKAERLAEAQRIARIGNWDWNILDNTLTWSDEIFRIFGLEPQKFEDPFEAFLSAVHPDDRPFVQESTDKALYENRPYSIDHRIVLPNGAERVVHEQAEIIRNNAGRPIRMCGTMQDITARKLAEDRNRIVAALLRLFQDKKTEKAYFDAVNEVVRSWCGCRCAGIRIVDGQGRIPYVSSFGFSLGFLAEESQLSLEKDPCVCTRALSGKLAPHEKLHVTSAGSFFCNDTRLFFDSLSPDRELMVRGACIKEGFCSIAIIPVKHLGKTLGALHLADEAAGRLPSEKIAFIENIAPLIGEAIYSFHVEKDLLSKETALRSLASRLTLAEERERKLLAAALHDTVNQTLALSRIKLGALNQMLDNDKAKAKQALQEILHLFSQAIEQTRSLSFELSPPILYELGLHAAVDWLGDKCREQYNFDFSLSGKSNEEDIPEHFKVLIFQSIRELLTNAGKHAGAKRVHVTLDHRDGELAAIVEDDGKGFDYESARKGAGQSSSIGLFSIEDRMRHLGGTFSVESVMGKGTRVELRAPLKGNGERGTRSAE